MAYAPTNWVDGVTPVNATNMNKLEQGLAAAVGIPADVVVPAANLLIRNRFAGADANPGFRLMGDGRLEWGPGGASAPDVFLKRDTVSLGKGYMNLDGGLWIDTILEVGGNINGWKAAPEGAAFSFPTVQLRNASGTPSGIFFGSGAAGLDTGLYRVGAGTLKSDGNLNVKGTFGKETVTEPVDELILASWKTGESQDRFEIYGNGTMYWGGGAAAPVTWLARGVDHQLVTENLMLDNGTLDINATGVATNTILGTWLDAEAAYRFTINGNGQMQWGPGGAAALDVTLRRSGAALQVDGSFYVNGSVFWTPAIVDIQRDPTSRAVEIYASADTSSKLLIWGDGKLEWGTGLAAHDTNLYRYAAGYLKTDGTLFAAKLGVQFGVANQIIIEADGRIYFGSAADVNLYRGAANVLGTDDVFHTQGGIKFADNSLQTTAAAAARAALGTVCETVADWNNAVTNGWFMGSGATNAPTPGVWYLGQVITHLPNYVVQRVTDFTQGSVSWFERRCIGSTWGAWKPQGMDYATTLPGSAPDGTEAVLVDSTTNPSYQWRFRYNAAGGSYKWEFIGGAPATHEIQTAESLGNVFASFVDLATVGPQLTVPRTGIYDIEVGGVTWGRNTPVGLYVKFGAQAVDTANGMALGAGGDGGGAGMDISSNNPIGQSRSFRRTVNAGDLLKVQYRGAQNNGPWTVAQRVLRLTPVKVA